jgi:hypothetical protein
MILVQNFLLFLFANNTSLPDLYLGIYPNRTECFPFNIMFSMYVCMFLDWVSFYRLSWSQTHDPPTSASRLLRLQACHHTLLYHLFYYCYYNGVYSLHIVKGFIMTIPYMHRKDFVHFHPPLLHLILFHLPLFIFPSTFLVVYPLLLWPCFCFISPHPRTSINERKQVILCFGD